MTDGSPPGLARPEMLRWARRSLGLEIRVAAPKAGVSVELLSEWEAGEAAPTIDQLRRLAGVYGRPLAVFFLPRPPSGFDVMRDFRRFPEATGGQWSPQLHLEFRRSLEQRETVLELLEYLDERPLQNWAITPGQSEDETADRIRSAVLGSSHGRPNDRDQYKRLSCWTSGLEALGVLVVTARDVDVEEMRGFSVLRHDIPIIAINGRDAPNARVFSALHEMAHLVLRTSGLCDQRIGDSDPVRERQLEIKCNAIAARVLMPRDSVLNLGIVKMSPRDFEGWTDELLSELTRAFGVSRESALRRLLDLGFTTDSYYQQRRREWAIEWSEQDRTPHDGVPTFYQIHPTTMSKGFIRLVDRARRTGAITRYEAASFMRARVGQIDHLAAVAGGGQS